MKNPHISFLPEYNEERLHSQELQKSLSDIVAKTSRTVNLLRQWRSCEYIGLFIDLPFEHKRCISKLADESEKTLRGWGYYTVDCDEDKPPPQAKETEPPMKYIVISEYNLLSFKKSVNAKIAEGWELQGGISSMLDANRCTWWSQALFLQ